MSTENREYTRPSNKKKLAKNPETEQFIKSTCEKWRKEVYTKSLTAHKRVAQPKHNLVFETASDMEAQNLADYLKSHYLTRKAVKNIKIENNIVRIKEVTPATLYNKVCGTQGKENLEKIKEPRGTKRKRGFENGDNGISELPRLEKKLNDIEGPLILNHQLEKTTEQHAQVVEQDQLRMRIQTLEESLSELDSVFQGLEKNGSDWALLNERLQKKLQQSKDELARSKQENKKIRRGKVELEKKLDDLGRIKKENEKLRQENRKFEELKRENEQLKRYSNSLAALVGNQDKLLAFSKTSSVAPPMETPNLPGQRGALTQNSSPTKIRDRSTSSAYPSGRRNSSSYGELIQSFRKANGKVDFSVSNPSESGKKPGLFT